MSETAIPRCTVLPASAATEDGWISHELEIRRSRFLGFAARVETEDAARAMIATLRRRFHDARHVCSAMVLGPGREVARSNDDGEPAGTAGTPLLEAILHRDVLGARDLTDVCVVVVRYFGGVKLGAGGLVRAYSSAASETLDTAEPVLRVRAVRAVVRADHGDAGRWIHELSTVGHAVVNTEYQPDEAVLHVLVPDSASDRAGLVHDVAHLSSGAQSPVFGETTWKDEA
ncbi:MAG: YigZ family protein [Micrococcus sp.]|nr:YigZ family protein [Micrococcus sp.]